MWATEAKGIDVEILPKWEEKELFRCTAPHHAEWVGCRKCVSPESCTLIVWHMHILGDALWCCTNRTFCEDHNTGTLPHKKYYDLAAYEKRRALKAAKKGKTAVRPFWTHIVTILACIFL